MMRRFDVQTIQMSISVLFVSAGVLFDDTGLKWVNGPVNIKLSEKQVEIFL